MVAALRLVGQQGETQFFFHFIHRQQPVQQPGAIFALHGQRLIGVHRTRHHVAGHSFKQVAQGDDALGHAKLIDGKGKVSVLLAKDAQQFDQRQG